MYRETVAVIPGSFKPPTKGHLEMIKKYSKMADMVMVFVSQPGPNSKSLRKINGEPINPMVAQYILNEYVKYAQLKNVHVQLSHNPSPVKDTYDFIEVLEDCDVIVGASKKDNDWKRWSSIAKYMKEHNPSVTIMDPEENAVEPEQYGDIDMSASAFREAIETGNPISPFLPDEIKEADQILRICKHLKLLTEVK